MRHLVCLVIDEAHRAMGNYSYCVVVREVSLPFFWFFMKELLLSFPRDMCTCILFKSAFRFIFGERI